MGEHLFSTPFHVTYSHAFWIQPVKAVEPIRYAKCKRDRFRETESALQVQALRSATGSLAATWSRRWSDGGGRVGDCGARRVGDRLEKTPVPPVGCAVAGRHKIGAAAFNGLCYRAVPVPELRERIEDPHVLALNKLRQVSLSLVVAGCLELVLQSSVMYVVGIRRARIEYRE